MRRAFTFVALLGALSLLAGGAAGATSHRTAHAATAKAASATFQDATGENASAPDITTITVSSDDAGNLSLRIAIPNRPSFTGDMELMAGFDTDGDPTTGAADIGGSDYLLTAMPDANGGIAAAVGRWNGLRFADFRSYPSLFHYADGLATITINHGDLGSTGKFSFFVAAASNIDFANDDYDNIAEDDAPDAGVWSFDTGLAQIRQPAATRLVSKQQVLLPTSPRAGKPIVFGVALVTDTGTIPTQGAVTCKATVGGRSLRATDHTMVEGGAACGWRVPKGTRGTLLHGSLTVRTQGLELTRSFAARIR